MKDLHKNIWMVGDQPQYKGIGKKVIKGKILMEMQAWILRIYLRKQVNKNSKRKEK